MRVFSAYFKILREMRTTIIIYISIFFGITMIFALSSPTQSIDNFTASKPNIAIFNKDNSILANGLVDYLKTNTDVIDLEDNSAAIADALFYRRITYVVAIPADFTTKFKNGESNILEIQQVPDSSSTIYAEMLINKYVNLARLYEAGNIEDSIMVEKIKNDLNKGTKVDIIGNQKTTNALEGANYYYNYTNYVFLSILILVIGMIMQAFKEENIRNRNLCSPIKPERMNYELMLGNLVVTLGIWLLFILGSIALIGKTMFTTNGLLLILSSFIFVMAALSISFLLGRITKSREAQSALANVFSLGSSFICGAFVPQFLLSKTVLLMGSILPSYWFIKANNLICTNTLNSTILKSVLFCFLIEVIFIIIMYTITFIISKYRHRSI